MYLLCKYQEYLIGVHCPEDSQTGTYSWDRDLTLFECKPTIAATFGPVSMNSRIT